MSDFLTQLVGKLAQNLGQEGPKRIQYAQNAVNTLQKQKTQKNTEQSALTRIVPQAYKMAQDEANKNNIAQPLEKYIRMFGFTGKLPQQYYQAIIPRKTTTQLTPEISETQLPNASQKGIPSIQKEAGVSLDNKTGKIYKWYLKNKKGITDLNNGKLPHVPEAGALHSYEADTGKKLSSEDRKQVAKQLRLINQAVKKYGKLPNTTQVQTQQPQENYTLEPLMVQPQTGGGLIVDNALAKVMLGTHPYLLGGILHKPEPVSNINMLSEDEINKAVNTMQILGNKYKNIKSFEGDIDKLEGTARVNFEKYSPLEINDTDIPVLAETAPYFTNSILGRETAGKTLPVDLSQHAEDIKNTLNSLASGYKRNESGDFKLYLLRLNKIYQTEYDNLQKRRQTYGDTNMKDSLAAISKAQADIKIAFRNASSVNKGKQSFIEIMTQAGSGGGGIQRLKDRMALVNNAYKSLFNDMWATYSGTTKLSNAYKKAYINHINAMLEVSFTTIKSVTKKGITETPVASTFPTKAWSVMKSSDEYRNSKDKSTQEDGIAKRIIKALHDRYAIFVPGRKLVTFENFLDTMYGYK